jgi:hypothetical protein
MSVETNPRDYDGPGSPMHAQFPKVLANRNPAERESCRYGIGSFHILGMESAICRVGERSPSQQKHEPQACLWIHDSTGARASTLTRLQMAHVVPTTEIHRKKQDESHTTGAPKVQTAPLQRGRGVRSARTFEPRESTHNARLNGNDGHQVAPEIYFMKYEAKYNRFRV